MKTFFETPLTQLDIVNRFRSDLITTPEGNFHALPDMQPYINHDAQFSRPAVQLQPGIFLDKEAAGISPLHENGIASCDFRLRPVHRLGREDSHNLVFFGHLVLQDRSRKAFAETEVAVKPIKKVKEGLGELAMFQYMRSLGIPTFRPIAFSKHSDTAYLMTEFDRPVNTMDTVEWHELDRDEKWQQVGLGVSTLALLHSNMLFHGDAEFKNIAFNDIGEIVIVDPEFMISARGIAEALQGVRMNRALDQDEATDLGWIKRKMSNDFTNLCRSVNRYVIGINAQDRRRPHATAIFKQYRKHIYLPYRKELYNIGSSYLPLLDRAYNELLIDRKEQSKQDII